MIISFKKYHVILAASMVLLIGAVFMREADNFDKKTEIIVIENVPATTAVQTIQTEKATKITSYTAKTKRTSKKVSSKNTTVSTSVISTKTPDKTAEISEVCTESVYLYIDINNANSEELIKLNGIGDYLAEQIITYREENGGFKNIEELVNVSGIGEKTFESIRDHVYVENPVYYVEEVNDEPEPIPEIDVIEEIIIEEVTDSPLTLENCSPINLNEADIELLILLPCVDEEIARKIIDLREEIGVFAHTYELLFVDGITEETLAEIIEYVYI